MCEMCDKFGRTLDRLTDALKPNASITYQGIRSSIASDMPFVVSDVIRVSQLVSGVNVSISPIRLSRPMANFKGIDRPYNPYLYIHSFALGVVNGNGVAVNNYAATVTFQATNGNRIFLGDYWAQTPSFNLINAYLHMPYGGNDVLDVGELEINVFYMPSGSNTLIATMNVDVGYSTAPIAR